MTKYKCLYEITGRIEDVATFLVPLKDLPKQEQGEPVAKMTAHRAMYFMERFKREEKLLGPNEQAAVDFVTAILNNPPPQQRKPLTDEQVRKVARLFSDRMAVMCNVEAEDHWKYHGEEVVLDVQFVLNAAHGIKE